MKTEQVVNVVMKPQNSILNRESSYSRIADTVAGHMVKSRGRSEVRWRPYIRQEGVAASGFCRDIHFDGRSFYPEARRGDAVYTACDIELEKDYELWINIIGTVKVFLDGESLFSSWEDGVKSVGSRSYISLPVRLSADSLHRLVIKTICTEGGFGYYLNISPPSCASLWASFYLVSARTLLPVSGLSGEEGIAVSPLYSSGLSPREAYDREFDFEKEPVYQFPKRETEEKTYNFTDIYSDGACAFAFSKAVYDGYACITARSATKILVNKKKYKTLKANEKLRIPLKKNDELLLKVMNEGDSWGFAAEEAEGLGLPFLDSERAADFTFAICGPFYQKGTEVMLPPEYAENLLQPFDDGRGNRVFWRFSHCCLRAYMNSSFWGQWYYATMLAFLGVEQCGEALDKPEYVSYFLDGQKFLRDWYEYACYDNDSFGLPSFMCGAAESGYLDNIGTMGTNFAEACLRTGDKGFLPLIDLLASHLKNKVSRFSDGTFCRAETGTMWADDFYMSGTFLARLYSLKHGEEILKDISCQLAGFKKRLYMPGEKIFSHIFFLDKGVKNNIPWGRGNGWIAFSMSELLLAVPEDSDAHKSLRQAFSEFCEGLERLQDSRGMWHQILNRPESYAEASCTAMFSLAFFRGAAHGWLPERFWRNAQRGLDALLRYCVDENGVVYGVCMGSSCSMDAKYYMELPSIKDDNHGTGIIMTLLCERIELERKGMIPAM